MEKLEPKQGAIIEALEIMEKDIKTLSETTMILTDRLRIILQPSSPEEIKHSEEPIEVSPIASRLYRWNFIIKEILFTIENTIKRLEI